LPRRNLKDIIVISKTSASFMFNLHNGIPVKEYFGDKQDLSLFSLTRYLKGMKECTDVRKRILQEFHQGVTNIGPS
jgi:TFIIF-interacting CTD phosphatase-like protein